jgi:hypothetical protein
MEEGMKYEKAAFFRNNHNSHCAVNNAAQIRGKRDSVRGGPGIYDRRFTEGQ